MLGFALRRALLTLLILSSTTAAAQTPATAPGTTVVPRYRARLLGVYDERNGEPLSGVRVSDVLSGMSMVTSSTGTVTLVFLPDGGSMVRLQKIGYEVQTMLVAISPRDTNPLTLVLRPAVELPAMVTRADSAPRYLSARLRGFEERRRKENGRFITEDVLRKHDDMPLGNLLRTIAPGVVKESGGSAMLLMQSPRCTVGGPPQVYLDGVPLTAPMKRGVANPPFDLMEFSVSDLAAVEYYSDGAITPMEFSHLGQRCGALLLWTRER